MKISVAVYAIFWPILINTIYGVAMTEPMRLDAARSMHWRWWRRQVFVTLPSATPSILTGIRISVGIALVVIISTELLGARYGVGTILVQYTAGRPTRCRLRRGPRPRRRGRCGVLAHDAGRAPPGPVGLRCLTR
ncbi:ABC transporter permease [Aeromicrobium sp. UC242_57]|uniref:ABC transporter permease n=1 Tax=Aeromicrobium sp. UC242_57 TaxID=3374624 RepID=UPI0037B63947